MRVKAPPRRKNHPSGSLALIPSPIKGGLEMTVIATLITKYATAHATDSRRMAGNTIVGSDNETKIIPVYKFRGAMSFYGLAEFDNDNFNMLKFLRGQANLNVDTPVELALRIRDGLRGELGRNRFQKPLDQGIGIHFSAYERVRGYLIPELFHISNFSDPTYSSLKELTASRETFGTMTGTPSQDLSIPIDEEQRLRVRSFLEKGGMFIYNNGDPVLFNPIAGAVNVVFKALGERRVLENFEDMRNHCDMIRRPVEIVANLLRDFAQEGERRVGGKIHDYVVRPNGQVLSTSGDG